MEKFKAIKKFSELCGLIKEGAILHKHYGLGYRYSLILSDEQKLKYGQEGSTVSKTIGRKFANQPSSIIETKTILAGHSYEITYKKLAN